MFPPMGFFSFAVYGLEAASGLETTWLVITTATPNYESY